MNKISRRKKTTVKVDILFRTPQPPTPPRKVIVHEEGRENRVGNRIDRITVSRTRRGVFTVIADKLGQGMEGEISSKWLTIESAKDIKTPRELGRALAACAQALDVQLDWEEVVDQVAEMDWLTAAVLASLQRNELPTLPRAADLHLQRALRPLGKVRMAVEWGYELHEVTMSLEQWVRILHGESYAVSEPYYYEGKRFTATWCFDKRAWQELHVTYDDGGEGWIGDFDDILVVNGSMVDGVDLARLCLQASIDPSARRPVAAIRA